MNIALICTDNESLSLGLRSISSALKAAGYQDRLIFMETGDRNFSHKTLEELSTLIRDCDIVGVSCLAQGSRKAIQVLEYIKQFGKPTIWGGVHASLNPEECAQWADFVCIGEGEGMMLEFVERFANSANCKGILNAAYLEDGKLIKNEVRPLILNLDELPLMDFSLDDEYHLTKDGFRQVHQLYNVERNGQIAFTSSRGCAFHCTYCCNIKLKNIYAGRGNYVRRMSVSRLIEHAQQLRRVFPRGKYFYFIDEDFAARPVGELIELAERFPKEVGLPFECLAHPSRMTEKNLDLLAQAGLFRVRIGIETGSERTKKEIYNRRVSNDTVKRAAMVISRKRRVAPVYFFMFANPYEEREDILATLKFIGDLPYGASIQAFELIFFPGSALYEQAVKDKFIQGNVDSSHEVNYYGGLHYHEYHWKQKNLYLNGLMFLAGSRITRNRIGMIPRFLYNYLIRDEIIQFNESHTEMIRAMIELKGFLWRVRAGVSQLLKKVVKDPVAIYNPGYFFNKMFVSKQND